MMNNDTLYNSIPKCFISKRLKYRLMELNDTDTVINLRNANHVRDNYIYQKPITVEEHINYYHTQIETGHIIQYVMMIPDTNKVIVHIPLERNSQSAIAVRLSAPNGKVCSN